MPWEVRKQGRRWCVYVEGETEAVACHDTEAEAQAQVRALYANMPEREKKSAGDDLLVSFGGAVKSLGGGRIAGLAVPFGSPDDLDLDGEFFTRDTDYGLDLPVKLNLYYQHGMDPDLGRRKIGRATLKSGEDGIHFEADLSWMEKQEDLARKYLLLHNLIEKGYMGASSATANHMVVKRPAGKGVWLETWLLTELSLTPTPANPATFGKVHSVKSLAGLPSFADLTRPEPVRGASLAESTERWLESGTTLVYDYRTVVGKELKIGRAISAARRERLRQMRDLLEEMLKETEPREAVEEDTEAPVMGAQLEGSSSFNPERERLRLRTRAALILGSQS